MNEKEMTAEVLEVPKEEGTAVIPSESMSEELQALSSHPLYERFAKGKSGSETQILTDFREMLALMDEKKENRDAAIGAMMTPPARSAVPDVALSERQKTIARAAGMTYQEYYELYGAVKGLR